MSTLVNQEQEQQSPPPRPVTGGPLGPTLPGLVILLGLERHPDSHHNTPALTA